VILRRAGAAGRRRCAGPVRGAPHLPGFV